MAKVSKDEGRRLKYVSLSPSAFYLPPIHLTNQDFFLILLNSNQIAPIKSALVKTREKSLSKLICEMMGMESVIRGLYSMSLLK